MTVGGTAYQWREKTVTEGVTDEQPFSDKTPLIRCGGTYSTSSSNLNRSFSGSQQNVLC